MSLVEVEQTNFSPATYSSFEMYDTSFKDLADFKPASWKGLQ